MTAIFVAAAVILLLVSDTNSRTVSNASLDRQLGKLSTSVDRLASASEASTALSGFQTEAAGGVLSRLTAKLTPQQTRRLAKAMAESAAAKSDHKLDPPLLQDIFAVLLTSSGPKASSAAAALLSLTSGLTSPERSAIEGVLKSGIPEVLKNFLASGSTELGKALTDRLVDKVFGVKPSPTPSGTMNIKLSLGNVRLRLTPNGSLQRRVVKVVIKEPPTSFLWYNRTWGRDDRLAFERDALAKGIKGKRLSILYACHPAVRKVLGLAGSNAGCSR
jgi:hypothetical protein